MATGSDTAVGYGMVAIASAIFGYYTLWVIILPFVDADQPIHNFFLPRVYAVTIPIIAGVIALMGLGTFLAIVTMKKKSKQKTS